MNKRIKPYKSRKEAVKRERIIMIVSSAFVMAALTMTGLYMKEQNLQEQDDGYSVDLTEMENNVGDKYTELVESVDPSAQVADNSGVEVNPIVDAPVIIETPVLDEELDYMPREDSIIDDSPVAEANSGQVEIPGLTDVVEEAPVVEEMPVAEEATEVTVQQPVFAEEEGLLPPVVGTVLMHYDMDRTVYFATLDQYKYNPAVIFQAAEGSDVLACSDATVSQIYQNEEIGQAVVLDLGNGYHVTYGQLKDLRVAVGDYVQPNQVIASVAAPTKYYSVEGSNLYFAMDRNGTAVNPEDMLP